MLSVVFKSLVNSFHCLFLACTLKVLTLAEHPGPRQLSLEEQRRLDEQEENTLRELRLFLRDVTKRLATDKRFQIFSKPVDIEEVSSYCTFNSCVINA